MDDEGASDTQLVLAALLQSVCAASDEEARRILADSLTTYEALDGMHDDLADFVLSSIRQGMVVERIVHLLPTATLEECVTGCDDSAASLMFPTEIAIAYSCDRAIGLTDMIFTEIARRQVGLVLKVRDEVDVMWARLVMHETDVIQMMLDERTRSFALHVLRRHLELNPDDRSINTFTFRIFLMQYRTHTRHHANARGYASTKSGADAASLLAAVDSVLPTLPDDVDVNELSMHLRGVIAWPDWNRLDLQLGIVCDLACGMPPLVEVEDIRRCYQAVMDFDFERGPPRV